MRELRVSDEEYGLVMAFRKLHSAYLDAPKYWRFVVVATPDAVYGELVPKSKVSVSLGEMKVTKAD
jgi:hypothetical protein